MNKIAPCLWFDSTGRRGRDVLHVDLQELEDQARQPLRRRRRARRPGGRRARPSPSRSSSTGRTSPRSTAARSSSSPRRSRSMVNCDNQDELDHYWNKLSEGGDPRLTAVRLAQGQVRPLLADRPDRRREDDDRPRPGQVGTGHEGAAPDEEARHPRPAAGVRGINSAVHAKTGERDHGIGESPRRHEEGRVHPHVRRQARRSGTSAARTSPGGRSTT